MTEERFPPDERHNVLLVGGPGDGRYMHLPETTSTLVWDSPWEPPEPGEYRRSLKTHKGRAMFEWYPAVTSLEESDGGS